jgi:phosphoribosyl-ATP pyrophosphohydrolase
VRGDRPKLVGESVDLFYQLLTLWAAVGIKPRAVWSELARRENLSSVAESATSDSDAKRRK